MNAPLSSACAPPVQAVTATSTFEYWTSTGFPANKLMLGAPTDSYIFNLTSEMLERPTYGPIPSFIYQKKASFLFRLALKIREGESMSAETQTTAAALTAMQI